VLFNKFEGKIYLLPNLVVNRQTGFWILDTFQDSFCKHKLAELRTQGLLRAAHGETPPNRTSTW
jgi:hypothetical protein